jgi:hypothetical protein
LGAIDQFALELMIGAYENSAPSNFEWTYGGLVIGAHHEPIDLL